MNPTLLILAAGIGSRYGGLKQADGIGPGGEAILDYSIYDAIKAGFSKVVFVIRKDIEEDMRHIFFEKWQDKVDIDHVFQETSGLPGGYAAPAGRTKPWGTGHAIWTARNKVREPFVVINADDFYGRKAYKLAAGFLADLDNLLNSRYCLIGYRLKNTLSEHGYVSRAECQVDRNGFLSSITERLKIKRAGDRIIFQGEGAGEREISGNAIVSMNIWGFMPSLFGYLERDMMTFLSANAESMTAEFLLPSVIDGLIRSDEVRIPVLETDAEWFGMTYREDREIVAERLRELAASGDYPSPVWR
jgi:UTP-glucose-1-phosphate uridylyltransferase